MAETSHRRIRPRYHLFFYASLPLAGLLLALTLSARGMHVGGAPSASAAATAVGIDTNTSGNTPTSLGTLQNCRETSTAQTFTVDFYITDVTGLLTWGTQLVYDGTVIQITNIDVYAQFQNAQAGSNVNSLSDPVPDSDGNYFMGAIDTGTANDTGTGVLARLTIQTVGAGFSPLSVVGLRMFNTAGTPIGDNNGDEVFDGSLANGFIAVNTSCTQDTDGDGTPDITDNCISVSNPSQLNTDADLAAAGARMGAPVGGVIPPLAGDSLGDACDPDDDNDSMGYTGGGLYFFRDELDAPAKIGTNPLLSCPTQGPPGTDPWPPDFNGSAAINSGDLVLLAQAFNSVGPGLPYRVRRDLSSDNVINSSDLVIFAKYFAMQCS